MTHTLRTSLLAAAALAVTAFVVPASAGPVPSQTATLSAVAPDNLIDVRERRRAPPQQDWVEEENWGARGGWGHGGWGYDNVGSLAYGRNGYAVNRFSGAHYNTCQEDLGYGRVRPCDAGSR